MTRGTQNEETRLMAAVLMRRSVAAATLATLVTGVAPMAVSLAAPSTFAASSITTDPAPDSSNVVAANRPKIVATFNDTPASGSITLTENGGSSTNLCGTPVINQQKHTVTCQPKSDLDTTKKYDAVGTATDSAGHKAKTATLTFTVDYPVLDGPSSAPVPNGTLTGGGENIVAAFNEAVTGNDKTTAPDGAFKLFEVNADGSRGLQLGGAITFDDTPVVGSGKTVTFNPTANLANGRYEAVLFVHGQLSNGDPNPDATGQADYSVFINNSAPFNLNIPVPQYRDSTGATRPFANTANNTAFPFSGFAAPGLTVTVSVTDPKDPNPLTNSYSDSADVAPCASAPSCPWTVPVDISGMTSPQNDVDWTASVQDVNGQPSSNPPTATASKQSPKATFDVDYSAPPTPTVAKGSEPAISSDSKTVTVSATESGTTDVVSYLVTITDGEGNKVTPSIPSQNQNLPATPIDVTSLDDGQLSIIIQAVDDVGNVSKPQSSPYHVTKDVGLEPNLGTSILSSDSGDTTFVEAEQESVSSPTKVTVGFTQNIKQSYQDQTKLPPATNDSSMCIASQNGNCIQGNAATVSSDHRSISMKVTSKLADGTYEVQVHTYSQGNCPDKTVQNSQGYNCEQFAGIVKDPNTGQPFTFTVDSTKPVVTITSFTNPVTAKNEKNVSVKGTVDKKVSTVQLLITSSGSSTAKLLANAAITQTTWAAGPLDLSSLPDGRLTIRATAKKSNGLAGHDTAHAKMQAHLSVLSETTNHHKVTAGHAIKISGHLSDETGQAIAHVDISVRPRFSTGHFGKAQTVVTDASGRYVAKFVPKHSATYYARYDGSPQHDGAKTHTARTLVRFKVAFTSPDQGARVSSPVSISGKVSPHRKGALVSIYLRTGSGKKLVGTARLNKHSHFRTKVALPAGKDKIFASVKKASRNLAGKSRLLTLHVS